MVGSTGQMYKLVEELLDNIPAERDLEVLLDRRHNRNQQCALAD